MNRQRDGRAHRRGARLARPGLAVGLAATLLGQASIASAATITVANACDVLVVPAGEAEEASSGTVIGANPGDTIVLAADSRCNPTFDSATGELLTGNGITIEADDVTLNLNGFDITSASDVAAAGEAAGLDVENAGVSVGGKNIVVTNSSSSVSVVSNFTANFDVKAENSRLVGRKLADGSFNLQGGNAHGGGALAIDDSVGLTIDTVQLRDLSANGDNGIDLKFSNNVTVKNSNIEGILTGIRIRNANNVRLENNTITGGCDAVEARVNVTNLVSINNVLNEGANCPAEAEEPEEEEAG